MVAAGSYCWRYDFTPIADYTVVELNLALVKPTPGHDRQGKEPETHYRSMDPRLLVIPSCLGCSTIRPQCLF